MIKKVFILKNKVIKNLLLDFTKSNGVYKNIILIGNNGTGKSTILDSLASFLSGHNYKGIKYVIYDINGLEYVMFPLKSASQYALDCGFSNIYCKSTKNKITTQININESSAKISQMDIRGNGVVYSKARTGFDLEPVVNTSTSKVDKNINETDDSSNYTKIYRLLIDLYVQDTIKFSELHKNKTIIDWDEFIESESSNIGRFSKAFNNFFENIKFNGIDIKNEIKVQFIKDGEVINLEDLSTGEQQIVLRGSLLLKNKLLLEGGVVLIDEPELSLHPLWQKKIFKYYKDLFVINGIQIAQLIIATHSQHLIQSAIEDNDCLILSIANDKNGTKANNVNYSGIFTMSEISKKIFGVYSEDYLMLLIGKLTGALNIKYSKIHNISEVDEYIYNNPLCDHSIYEKIDNFKKTTYKTLPIYIRNHICHPESIRMHNDNQLVLSIDLLLKILLNDFKLR